MKSIILAAAVLATASCQSGHRDVASTAEKIENQGRKCPAENITVGGRNVLEILSLIGARLESGATDKELLAYTKIFNRLDTDSDGKHSRKEYIDNGTHMNPRARRGIFAAADNNADGFVTRTEYVLNRVITDEAKGIVQSTDRNEDGKITKAEFVAESPLKDKQLASAVFDALDTDGNGMITIPEYLRVWGGWARPDYRAQEASLEK